MGRVTMPNVKKPKKTTEVDLTRKTKHGTEYRVVRASTVGADADKPWVTICLTHDAMIASDTLKLACAAGTQGRTVEWCTDCKKMAARKR